MTSGHNLFSGTSGFQFHAANMDTECLCGTSIQISYTHNTPKKNLKFLIPVLLLAYYHYAFDR